MLHVTDGESVAGTLREAGLPGEVIVEGRLETIDATLVEPVTCGDLVLVHAGVALTALGGNGP